MASEYVNINDIHKSVPAYQLHGIIGTNNAELVMIGQVDSESAPSEVLYLTDTSKLGAQTCKTFTYVHTELQKSTIKVLRVVLEQDTDLTGHTIIGDVILQFETSDIVDVDKEMTGEYYLVNGQDDIKIKKLEKYPSNDIIMYNIIEHLLNAKK